MVKLELPVVERIFRLGRRFDDDGRFVCRSTSIGRRLAADDTAGSLLVAVPGSVQLSERSTADFRLKPAEPVAEHTVGILIPALEGELNDLR